MIDLRSDTVTKPSAEMRAAMMSAAVGDDVYGDDPTANSLEERVAALFGFEAALFTATGSLANQLAIRQLVKPGEELITETFSHIVRAELGAGAAFSGITTRTWESPRGILRAADPLRIARPDSGPYQVSTTAIAVENTHNFGGGTVQSITEIQELREQSLKMGLLMHLDGARIWNAHVASGVSFLEYGKYFDTVSVCLSKGLGAPVGSLMLSNKERVASARIWRKRYGGGMRQIGMLAAAGHYALDNNIDRLSQDHAHARSLASAVSAVSPAVVNPAEVDTNIVILDLAGAARSAAELNGELKNAGILASTVGPTILRLVTHLDVSAADVAKVNSVLPELVERAFKAK
ncbi:MAG: GntG family PLP-dependent aldolase [Actinomycetes bacterium]